MGRAIRNAKEISTGRAARDALGIIEAALGAADPARIVPSYISGNTVRLSGRRVGLGAYRRVCLIAYGKAAGPMAEAAERNAEITDGIVIVPEGSPAPRLGRKYTVIESSHPVPSAKSARAADAVIDCTRTLGKNDYALFLVSGGGSAMLASPLNVNLADKVRTNTLLTKSGASIGEINCVRRHLSKVKGGRLVAGMACSGAALLMSDVRGDRPYDIASGCTCRDPTTFADALGVIKKHRLGGRMPRRVMSALRSGARAGGSVRTRRIPNVVIASNRNCVRAMKTVAGELGYDVSVVSAYGDVQRVAQQITARLSKKPMSCVVFGGEPTVRVAGRGRGGRNQELVARILGIIDEPGLAVASVGTDGIDGNTEAAGALAESATIDGAEIARYLRHNNSNALFARHGRLVITGHTGTNLGDVGVLVRRG